MLHGDSELLNSLRSNIQDGHLENLQTTSAPKRYVRLSPNLVRGIGATLRFSIC